MSTLRLRYGILGEAPVSGGGGAIPTDYEFSGNANLLPLRCAFPTSGITCHYGACSQS